MSAPPTRDLAAFEFSEAGLAVWAQHSAHSRGRLHAEPEHRYRSAFARDRDRVLHSHAFRRLQYKTQVFVRHEGDHYRNRLTHTLEGSQIARTLARALRLNEDLAEATVLAHDLGHTPFGHSGEAVLNVLLEDEGGFDHNRQTLRIVDWFEQRYPNFRGLNLTWETREALLKHGADWPHPVPLPELGAQPSLEAQVADLADEIAYLNHDLDDGLRAGLLDFEQLEACTLFAAARTRCEARYGKGLEPAVLGAQVIIALLDQLVSDLVEATRRALESAAPESAEAVRKRPGRLVHYSSEMNDLRKELKDFLYQNLYHHPEVRSAQQQVECVLSDLYHGFCANPSLLPMQVVTRFEEEGRARAIADYIAGMTDRFARVEHEKLRGR